MYTSIQGVWLNSRSLETQQPLQPQSNLIGRKENLMRIILSPAEMKLTKDMAKEWKEKTKSPYSIAFICMRLADKYEQSLLTELETIFDEKTVIKEEDNFITKDS
jgi:hypothetical protein